MDESAGAVVSVWDSCFLSPQEIKNNEVKMKAR